MGEPICKDLAALRPEAQKVAELWLQYLQQLQLDVRVTETLRSAARQAELQHAGESSVVVGWHQVGLGWDYAVFDGGVYVADGTDWRYQLAGLVGKALGCKWPIHLANGEVDADHLEYHPGFTLQQFLNGQKAGVV